jgi:hypothetical protein
MYQDNSCSWCYGQPINKEQKYDENETNDKREHCESDVNICTSVNIWQDGEANGGNANGGNGGDATSGSAAAASTESEGEDEDDQSTTPEEPASLESELSGENASAIGGDATGGAGGAGGTGGTGGSVSNSASVSVENVVVICCDENGSAPCLTLGTNNRKVIIKVDENGDTYVNGQKMNETELEDGTKVFIFRNSEVKK